VDEKSAKSSKSSMAPEKRRSTEFLPRRTEEGDGGAKAADAAAATQIA
jgi:hypothetical protein